MATVYASTNDAHVYKSLGGVGWNAVHDSTTGTTVDSNDASYQNAVRANCVAGGRGNIWLASRVLMDFDTSGISVAPSAATLKVYGITNNTADIIVAKQRHGPIGNIKLHFEAAITKFSDLADEHRYDNEN